MWDGRRRALRARPADTRCAQVLVVRVGQSHRQAADRARDGHDEQHRPTKVVQISDQVELEDGRRIGVVRRPRRKRWRRRQWPRRRRGLPWKWRRGRCSRRVLHCDRDDRGGIRSKWIQVLIDNIIFYTY